MVGGEGVRRGGLRTIWARCPLRRSIARLARGPLDVCRVRAGATPAEMARGGSLLYGPGAGLVVLSLLLPHPGAMIGVLGAEAVVAALVSAALWRWGARLPSCAYPALTAFGIGLITLAIHVGGPAGSAYALFYVWAALYSWYFFRAGQIVFQMSLIAGACAASGLLRFTGPLEVVMVVGTVLVAGLLMRAAVAALHRREVTFRLLFESNPQPMWVYDARSLEFLAVNQAALEAYGYTREGLLGMRLSDIETRRRCSADDASPIAPPANDRGHRGACHRRWDGGEVEVEIQHGSLRFDGREARLELLVDVTEQRALHEELCHRATHHPLTGLANRALLRERLDHALLLHGDGAARLAVIVIDLDNFKAVNDALGHAIGDQLLAAVASRLSLSVRPEDTVAHVGGDEFAVLLERTDAGEVRRLAGVLLAAFRRSFVAGGTEIFVNASLGAALGSRGCSADELLRDADVAMYSAKEGGKGGFQIYEPAHHRPTLRRLGLATELRRGLEREEFLLEYQPVISLHTGRMESAEALIRWEHPSLGRLAPGQFISIAEETGLIVPIGRWVLDSACAASAEWRRTVDHRAAPAIAVNVSARQLREPDFVGTVLEALQHAGLEPGALILEVTETALVHDVVNVRAKLQQLREVGVRVAMDDFGSGYSSLGYLHALPVDVVKIDRLFTASLGVHAQQRGLTGAIVRLLDTLDVVSVAEGVESQAQLDHLRVLGVDLVQGFHLGRAIDAAEIAPLCGRRILYADDPTTLTSTRLTLGTNWRVAPLSARAAR